MTSALAATEARAIPLRRAKPEEQLQKAIISLWRIIGRRDCIIHHSPNGAGLSKGQQGRAKGMGTLAGFPDLIIIEPGGQSYLFEIKAENGRLSKSQEDFERHCTSNAIPFVVLRSIEEAQIAWRFHGLTRGMA